MCIVIAIETFAQTFRFVLQPCDFARQSACMNLGGENMKNSKLINAEVSYVVASLGHFDGLTICDAGLPIPAGVQRIDLAVTEGVPSLMDVLKTIVSEMEIQEVELAEESKAVSPEFHKELLAFFETVAIERGKPIPVCYVSHEVFKENTRESVAIVRTGEFTPYANVTIKAGVAF